LGPVNLGISALGTRHALAKGNPGGAAMKCSDIMSKNLEWLSDKDTIARAAGVMDEAGIGFLPICNAAGKVVGVVTDRDLVTRGVAKGLDPAKTPAAKIMSAPAITCRADADLRLAEELMAEERKSRIVVTSPDGLLAGVVSIANIIEHAPKREALSTVQAVLWREALGPRGGAGRGQPLLKDEPVPPQMPERDLPHTRESVFSGGHHGIGTKEFP
jgi:CBS domain-containing protein